MRFSGLVRELMVKGKNGQVLLIYQVVVSSTSSRQGRRIVVEGGGCEDPSQNLRQGKDRHEIRSQPSDNVHEPGAEEREVRP